MPRHTECDEWLNRSPVQPRFCVNCLTLNHQLCWCDPKRFYRSGEKIYPKLLRANKGPKLWFQNQHLFQTGLSKTPYSKQKFKLWHLDKRTGFSETEILWDSSLEQVPMGFCPLRGGFIIPPALLVVDNYFLFQNEPFLNNPVPIIQLVVKRAGAGCTASCAGLP